MPRSGITFSPELEWFEAAAWSNYKWDEFLELEGEMQSQIIAAYEAHNQIEAVVAQEQARQAAAKARRK